MRLNIKQRDARWYEKKHQWFAWFPVRLESGEVAWLEWVERVDEDPLYDVIKWTYRACR